MSILPLSPNRIFVKTAKDDSLLHQLTLQLTNQIVTEAENTDMPRLDLIKPVHSLTQMKTIESHFCYILSHNDFSNHLKNNYFKAIIVVNGNNRKYDTSTRWDVLLQFYFSFAQKTWIQSQTVLVTSVTERQESHLINQSEKWHFGIMV